MKRTLLAKWGPPWLAVTLAVAAVTLLVPTSQAAGPPECLVTNERTGLGARSLQNAIDAAVVGDLLVVKGTCVGISTITKDLNVKGHSNPRFGQATLDGGGLGTVLSISGTVTVAVDDLAIINGTAQYEGGGINNWYGTVALSGVVVRSNSAPTGGGISTRYGVVSAKDSIVSGNTGITGGGIFTAEGMFTLIDSIVSGNNATPGEGGGIFNATGTLTLTRSTVADNSASYDGGGITNTGTFTLNESTVTGNTSYWGGGIANWYGAFTLNDSIVRGNNASFGGGVYIFGGGPFTLTGTTTITGNTPDDCYPPDLISGCTN